MREVRARQAQVELRFLISTCRQHCLGAVLFFFMLASFYAASAVLMLHVLWPRPVPLEPIASLGAKLQMIVNRQCFAMV